MNHKTSLVSSSLYFVIFMLQSPLASALTPESGWWWNAKESGRGFNIEVQNNIVSAAVYIYDDAGNPVWYLASGKLDGQNKLEATLSRFQGGQCITCAYQKPEGPETTGSMSIKFNTATTAEVTWAGGTIAIERFNYGYGAWYEGLLGGWMLVKTNPGRPLTYSGDQLTLTAFTQQGSNYFVSGSRTNDRTTPVVMTSLDDNSNNAYSFLAIVGDSDEFVHAYAFNFTGLNSIEGIHRLVKKNDSESNIIEQLTSTGKKFIGKRM